MKHLPYLSGFSQRYIFVLRAIKSHNIPPPCTRYFPRLLPAAFGVIIYFILEFIADARCQSSFFVERQNPNKFTQSRAIVPWQAPPH
jgi:hypothetical protein